MYMYKSKSCENVWGTKPIRQKSVGFFLWQDKATPRNLGSTPALISHTYTHTSHFAIITIPLPQDFIPGCGSGYDFFGGRLGTIFGRDRRTYTRRSHYRFGNYFHSVFGERAQPEVDLSYRIVPRPGFG
jgi:hypothetical protein